MMMLRSSSTPFLGSLISSFSESPNNIPDQVHSAQTPPIIRRKLSRRCNKNGGGSQISGESLFRAAAADSVPSCPSIRRVQSEGNIRGWAADDDAPPSSRDGVDELSFSKKTRRRNGKPSLETIPSFSNRASESRDEEDANADQGKMYAAAGLGIGGGGIGGGGSGGGRPVAFDMGGGGDGGGLRLMEQRYKKMLEENRGNSLVLRNYAQFLYKRKGDIEGAEEYYSRAILADSQDGEVLSEYAKMIWEARRDKERARSYFERAVRASSKDSHIHAAYASFLWDIDGEEEDSSESEETLFLHSSSFMAAAKLQPSF